MADTGRIDVPVAFDVPDGWAQADPGTSGFPFVLVRPEHQGDFMPNVTVGFDRRDDDVDIDTLADKANRASSRAGFDVSVVDRQDVGNDRAPGVAQVALLSTPEGERLVESQVLLTIPLGDTPSDRLMVELTCTCRPEQAATVMPEFQRLVASFHIRQGEDVDRE